MMNDRFSAELRQHLLTTADERPGDGRLTAIVEGVAVTGQRHRLVTRLPWSTTRLDPFPSRAMRYGLLVAGLIVALMGAAMFAAGQAHRTPFEGTWTTTDPGDGSTQTLMIGAGGSPTVRFQDEIATGGACDNDPTKVFTADGTGAVTGNHLDISFPDGGGCGSTTVEIALQLVYDDGTDSLRDQDGVDWIRLRGDRPAVPSPTTTPAVATPTPTSTPSSAAPTPHEGEATFTSEINGFSMGVPAGWKTRPATEPWTGGPLDFDSPAADVIFDPSTKDGDYLVVASQPFSGMSGDAWRTSVLEWTCHVDSSHTFWSWRVDGIHSDQFGPCNSGSLVQADTRGYLFRLVSPRAERLGMTDHFDTIKPMLETVDLHPEDAVDAAGAGASVPTCSEIAGGATYANRYGTPKLSATVPVTAKNRWLGYRDGFDIGSDCQYGRPVWISARTIDSVQGADACDASEPEVIVTSPAEAAEAIAVHRGHTTSASTDLEIDGRPAIRLEISGEGSTCDDGIKVWPFDEFVPEANQIIYLVDMNGSVLGISLSYIRDQTTSAQLAEAEAIAESIRVAS